jgi:hypothetical protein
VAWKRHNVTADRVVLRNPYIGLGSVKRWEKNAGMFQQAMGVGHIKPAPKFSS